MAFPGAQPDRSILAGRIQGFGNNNPPPLEEEKGADVAKKALGRLGDMMGEEVMLTVDDFREKGAVGAVKDAVADAGDILIDGVSGLVGWIRGDPVPEDDGGMIADAANQALSCGPGGAAYGVSQASPTGGINAVWVMPEDADPTALLSLTQQPGGGAGLTAQSQDPRVPKNIQPYQAPTSRGSSAASFPQNAPLSIPGGPVIAPYEPAPSGLAGGIPPYVPGGFSSSNISYNGALSSSYTGGASSMPQGRWGQAGYSASTGSGGAGAPSGSGGATSSAAGKALVDRISKGEVLVGPDVAKRLTSQCSATGATAKQLAETICECASHLYLGLDGGDPADADASLARLLDLTDALRLMGTDFTQQVVKAVTANVSEELLSLRSSAKHKDAAEPQLRNLGLLGKTPDMPDLLGSGGAAAPSQVEADLLSGAKEPAGALDLLSSSTAADEADLLGSAAGAPAEADLLGDVSTPSCATDLLGSMSIAAAEVDLLGASCTSSSSQSANMTALDPLLSSGQTSAQVAQGSNPLAGLTMDAFDSAANIDCALGSPSPAPGGNRLAASMPAADAASHAALDSMEAERVKKTKGDAFGFVGEEIDKAQKPIV